MIIVRRYGQHIHSLFSESVCLVALVYIPMSVICHYSCYLQNQHLGGMVEEGEVLSHLSLLPLSLSLDSHQVLDSNPYLEVCTLYVMHEKDAKCLSCYEIASTKSGIGGPSLGGGPPPFTTSSFGGMFGSNVAGTGRYIYIYTAF